MEALRLEYQLNTPLNLTPPETAFATGSDVLKLLSTIARVEQSTDEHPQVVNWRLDQLSGTHASLTPISAPEVASRASLVLVRGFGEAESQSELPLSWNLETGHRAARIASRLGETLETGMRLSVVSTEAAQVVVTRRAGRNLRSATKVRYTSYGSITGILGNVSAYRRRRASLWADATRTRVEVSFGAEQIDAIRDAWAREHVEVTGLIEENSAGQPLRVQLAELVVLGGRRVSLVDSIPSGFYPDMTGGLGPAEYLAASRGK